MPVLLNCVYSNRIFWQMSRNIFQLTNSSVGQGLGTVMVDYLFMFLAHAGFISSALRFSNYIKLFTASMQNIAFVICSRTALTFIHLV